MTVAAAGYGQLIGYFGSECPHGPSIHLSPVWVAGSAIDFETIIGPTFGPDTQTHLCPDCLQVQNAIEPGG